ncbi:glycosyltransferase family 61 protein [Acidimicrobiaceae bacterium]|nr:glycosyltransferase family 61 protein [Acidimicrobiaceae bacterium]
MSKKLFKKISIRFKPINLKPEDEYLFEKEFKKTLPGSRVYKLKNITISNSVFKKFKYFRIKINHQRMNSININTKIRFLFKDFLEIFIIKKNKKTNTIEKGIWVIDSRSNQYFHWMTDALQRIFAAKEYNSEYPILLTSNFKNNPFVEESLKLLNLNHIQLDHEKQYLIKEFILSERVTPAGNYRVDIINQIADELKSTKENLNSDLKMERIWISRQKVERRKINNFDDIEEILQKYKFHILEFETYKLPEQILMLKNCKVLGGVHGAGLTNMLFMPKNSKILEVRAKNDDKNNCFFSLASDLKMKYYYFLSSTDDENFYSTNHHIDKGLFEDFIRKSLDN